MPKGSIRAIATLVTAGCSWGLLFTGGPVPDYVLDLLLTIIGYYFGFRQKVRETGGRVSDASVRAPEPLGLPGGTIRMMLIAGFGISTRDSFRARTTRIVGLRGVLSHPGGPDRRVLLLCLSRRRSRAVARAVLINHAKGVIVLIATVQLAVLLLRGHAEQSHLGLTMACIISFYFGSRS